MAATDASVAEEEESNEHSSDQCCDHERHSGDRSIDSNDESGSDTSSESSHSSSDSGSSSTATDSDSSHESVHDNRTTKKKKTSKKQKNKTKTTVIQKQTKSKTAKNPYCCSTAGRCVRSCAAYGQVCPLLADAAGRAAAEHISKICEGSVLFQDCCCSSDVKCSGKNSTVPPSTVPKKKNKKKAVGIVSQEEDPADGDTSESTVCGNASATSFCSFNNSNHSTDHENNKNSSSNSQFSCFSNVRIIEPSDIVMGEKLGEGGFCNVHSCALKMQKETSTSTKSSRARESGEEGTVSTDLNSILTDETCAVKFLRREVTAHRKTFQVRNPGRQFFFLFYFAERTT